MKVVKVLKKLIALLRGIEEVDVESLKKAGLTIGTGCSIMGGEG